MNTREFKPYRVQSITQFPFSTLASDEILQNPKFVYATRLYSPRIVKNIALMIGEHKFVIDPVLASLAPCLGNQRQAPLSLNDTNIHGRVKLNLVGSETRLADKKGLDYEYMPPHFPGR